MTGRGRLLCLSLAGNYVFGGRLRRLSAQGIYYFNTYRYKNKSQILAVDFKLYNGHIQKTEIEHSIGDSNFIHLSYEKGFISQNPQWKKQEKPLLSFAQEIIKYNTDNYKVHLFPMAPIPLLISLGFYLQDNFPLLIYQYDRKTSSWIYNVPEENSLIIEEKEINGKQDLVVKISTSLKIENAQIEKALDVKDYDKLYFEASHICLGTPLGKDKTDEFASIISSEVNKVASSHNNIHIFAAIPAGLSVALGRKLLKSLYKNIYLYNFDHGHYSFSFAINETGFEDKLAHLARNHEP